MKLKKRKKNHEAEFDLLLREFIHLYIFKDLLSPQREQQGLAGWQMEFKELIS